MPHKPLSPASEALICRPGNLAYQAAHLLQQKLAAARQINAFPDTLLLTEHPPTFTCGRSTRDDHLLLDPRTLQRRGYAVHSIERGGSVTYHGPGQLVGYPIVDLRRHGRDVHRHIRRLEEALIHTLAAFGLQARARPGLTGVWVGTSKIAAIGIYVRRWIAMHGFALNICPDLEPFGHIRPCGLDSQVVTSMARLLTPPPTANDIAAELITQLAGLFCWTPREIPYQTLLKDLDHIALTSSTL